VLELRPNCECCDRDLPPDATDDRICTMNAPSAPPAPRMCSMVLAQLRRYSYAATDPPPPEMLVRHPASTKRVVKSAGGRQAV